jgi:TonB family protein
MILGTKHLLLLVKVCLFATCIHGQKEDSNTQADQMPYFKGCEKYADGSVEKRNCSNQSLVNYIAKNLEIPKNTDAVGIVYVTFGVDEAGAVIDAVVLRGLEKAQDETALKVVRSMPAWEPARLNNIPLKVKMTLPIRFVQKDESEYSNGFQVTWGQLKGKKVGRDELIKALGLPITIRDEVGNTLDINELMFERTRGEKFVDAQSKGVISSDMQKIVKKLKSGDTFTLAATVQKKGQFYYVDRSFEVE